MKRGRPVYCRDPADWDRIRVRAEAVGRSVSDFVMICALHDGPPTPTAPLILTPQEQRDLVRKVNALDSCLETLFLGGEHDAPTMVDAVLLLYLMQQDDLEDEPDYDRQEAQE